MKISAIKKIVTDSKRCIVVTDKEGRQWIGDGKRFYAVDEDIRFKRETVLAMLDIDKDKRDKVAVFEEASNDPRFDVYQQEEGERLIPQMAVMYGGDLVMIFMADRQEIFALEHATLKPIDNMGRAYTLRRRTANGEEMRPVIAVQTDMFVSALLTPMYANVAAAIRAEMEMISRGEVKSYGGEDEDMIKEINAED